jgi:hypothetical protein
MLVLVVVVATVVSALEGINIARKYLMRFHVDDNIMAAVSCMEGSAESEGALTYCNGHVEEVKQITF